ncbi:hypothetical protein CONPUDRAFT_60830 [Coniophora puteana RWD-64-598 SS2]|uniref:Protein kinase domain-containing protein n=1 Tax=Coniophora puteana (strain RWD-64-598) TaxID=741705 RepID=A0A5M3MI69_CONPW|nr:uncharacterized protein CONPUDRAFT_60830 [Coniophora puteana RWD-64-598 SS2]EIW78331.1 hypothetical protein CONPUDRAFT_60830 [Coniophora puteana RWD-64-598 SS2]
MFFRTCTRAECDLPSLAFQLSPVFGSHNNASSFFSQKGQNAQTLVDILQAILMRSKIDARSQRMARYAMIHLAANSSRYPQCLNLRNVTWGTSRMFARGKFADIYKGNIKAKPDVQLAVKVFRMHQTFGFEKPLKYLAREATVWGQLRHPNILPFYGVLQQGATLSLASPYLKYGQVRHYLEIHPSTNRALLVRAFASRFDAVYVSLLCSRRWMLRKR